MPRYNYDRCLSAAIYEEVIASARTRRRGAAAEGATHRLLNGGFDTFSEKFAPIDENRFALLKMHGQIAISLGDRPGDTDVEGIALDTFGKAVVDDRILDRFGPHSSAPILFFPWETRLPERIADLRRRIEGAAGQFLASAIQIKVAGFSFHDANTKALDPLLARATRCRVIDLYDPSREVLARVESLVARHGLGAKVIQHGAWLP